MNPVNKERPVRIPKCSKNIIGQINHEMLNSQNGNGQELYLDQCVEVDRTLFYLVHNKQVRVSGCEGCEFFRGK